jgi:alkyl hydroperoxide reductase subunit AhpF
MSLCRHVKDGSNVAKDLGGQAVDSTKIENYLGFDFITGPKLIDKFKPLLAIPLY